MKQTRKKPPKDIDFTKSLIMAVVGVAILFLLFYIFNGARFPSDISYEHVRMGF